MSATPDSTIADPDQRIADLERQLAEALEQQTATAEVLQVINSSPGELAPVFDAMLERALRLCEASFGILFIRDGERCSGVATRNLPPSLVDIVQEPFRPSPVGFLKKAARGQAFEHVTDLSADTPRVSGDPRARALLELGGARTILSATRTMQFSDGSGSTGPKSGHSPTSRSRCYRISLRRRS